MTNDKNYTLSVTHPQAFVLPSDYAQVLKVVPLRLRPGVKSRPFTSGCLDF